MKKIALAVLVLVLGCIAAQAQNGGHCMQCVSTGEIQCADGKSFPTGRCIKSPDAVACLTGFGQCDSGEKWQNCEGFDDPDVEPAFCMGGGGEGLRLPRVKDEYMAAQLFLPACNGGSHPVTPTALPRVEAALAVRERL